MSASRGLLFYAVSSLKGNPTRLWRLSSATSIATVCGGCHIFSSFGANDRAGGKDGEKFSSVSDSPSAAVMQPQEDGAQANNTWVPVTRQLGTFRPQGPSYLVESASPRSFFCTLSNI